jgi:hypothetical protein
MVEKISLSCPYKARDGYCVELKKPCPHPNDADIRDLIGRIRSCPYAGLFNTIESKAAAVMTLFFQSMGFNVEIHYNHVTKYMDSLTIRGYRDGKMVFNISYTENRRQIRRRMDTLRDLFYALISTT